MLDQRDLRTTALRGISRECVKGTECSAGKSDAENRATARNSGSRSRRRCAIEVSICRLHQTADRSGSVAAAIEVMEHSECAAGGDAENDSVIVSTAVLVSAIEVAVTTLDQGIKGCPSGRILISCEWPFFVRCFARALLILNVASVI